MLQIYKGSLIAILLSFSLNACADTTTRTETETTVSHDGAIATETTRSTTTESDTDSCDGILSCTVDTLGSIIALPFKAVGALVDAIF